MRDESREPQLTEQPISSPYSRLSLWTIRPEWISWFYLLLTLQAIPLIGSLWWSENHSGAHDNIASTISTVAGGSASLIFVAATASVIELETLMVLRHLLEKRDARKEREKTEKTEQRIREAYDRGRKDEREAQTASRDIANQGNGNQGN